MEAEFWHGCWQRDSLGWHQQEHHPFLAQYLLPQLEVQTSNTKAQNIFVPLCGKSQDMWWLSQHANVIGAELSEIACQDFFDEQNIRPYVDNVDFFQRYQAKSITLWQGDFFKLDAIKLPKVDWIYDRAALIALPKTMQRRYADHLQTFLGVDNQLFLVTLEFPEAELDGPPFPIFKNDVEQLFSGFDIEELAQRELPNKQFAQRTFNVSNLKERLFSISRK